MKRKKTPRGRFGGFILLAATPALTACNAESTAPEPSAHVAAHASVASAGPSFPVSGSSIHYFTTGIVHSQEPTAVGHVQRSTEIVHLTGDLEGYVLYHPRSVFDFAAGTLVNTGTQVFSGTVAGSGPVLLHDDTFRFDVDLSTGATTGEVHLGRSADAPHRGHWYECDLDVVGTGLTPAGDAMADYSGTCTRYGNPG